MSVRDRFRDIRDRSRDTESQDRDGESEEASSSQEGGGVVDSVTDTVTDAFRNLTGTGGDSSDGGADQSGGDGGGQNVVDETIEQIQRGADPLIGSGTSDGSQQGTAEDTRGGEPQRPAGSQQSGGVVEQVEETVDDIAGGVNFRNGSSARSASRTGRPPASRLRGAQRAVRQDLTDNINDPLRFDSEADAQRAANTARALNRASEVARGAQNREQFGDISIRVPNQSPVAGGRRVEDLVEDAGGGLADAASGAVQASGGLRSTTVVPTGSGLAAPGLDNQATTQEREFAGSLARAPADAFLTGKEAVEFGAAGAEATVGGEGGEFAERTGEAAVDRAELIAEEAEENPARLGGQLAGSTVGTSLLLGGAGALSPTAGRATAFAVQPGEELAISAGRSVPRLAGAASRVPGVSRSQIDAGDGGGLGLGNRVRGGVESARSGLGNVNRRTPGLEVRRDADAGFLEIDPGALPDLPNVREALTPTPRRGTGEFAVDADVSGGFDLPERIRLTRQAAEQRLLGGAASTDLGLQQVDTQLREALTPTPQRGTGEFAVDADTADVSLPDGVRDRVTGAAASADLGLQRVDSSVREALTPEPRRGSGEFAVDADIRSGDSALGDRIGEAREAAEQRLLGGAASADLGFQRVDSGLREALTPEPRRGSGEFAVESDVFGDTGLAEEIAGTRQAASRRLLGGAATVDLGLQRARSGLAQLPARTGLAARRTRRSLDEFGTDLRFTAGEARAGAAEFLTPEPRRGSGEFAVDAGLTDDIDLGLRRRLEALGETTVRVRAPRPERQDFTLDADLFEDADVGAFDTEIETGGAGRGGGGQAEVAVLGTRGETETETQAEAEALEPGRTGTGTDAVASESEFDLSTRPRAEPTLDNVSEPFASVDEDLGVFSSEGTGPSLGEGVGESAGTGLFDGLRGEFDFGTGLDFRQDIRTETSQDTRGEVFTEPESRVEIETRREFDTALETATESEQRQELATETEARSELRSEAFLPPEQDEEDAFFGPLSAEDTTFSSGIASADEFLNGGGGGDLFGDASDPFDSDQDVFGR
jgi:hypothetical protein